MKKRLFKQNAAGENVRVHITLIASSNDKQSSVPHGDPTIASMAPHIDAGRIICVLEMPANIRLFRNEMAEQWAQCPSNEGIGIACGDMSICQEVYEALKMK